MNKHFTKDKICNTPFFKNTPADVVRDTLLMLIENAYRECTTTEEKSYLESKFNSYKNNPTEIEWYGFFCELVYRDWLKGLVKPESRVVFAQKSDNDLKIITRSESYRVEVKAIQDNDFDKIKSETIRKIAKIPTGKSFSIKLKNDIDRRLSHKKKVELFKCACNELVDIISNGIESNNWEVKEIGAIKDGRKTGLMGFTHAYWVNNEYLEQSINNHLIKNGSIREQIKKTNIICFYFLDSKFDAEDITQVLENLPREFDNKIIGYFTKWQQGKPRFFSKKKHGDKVLDTIVKGYSVNK